jgi:hypothetical protein
MYYDRFDIVEAYYLYLQLNQNGQGSRAYKRLCRIKTYFKPGMFGITFDRLSENGQAIFKALQEKDL